LFHLLTALRKIDTAIASLLGHETTAQRRDAALKTPLPASASASSSAPGWRALLIGLLLVLRLLIHRLLLLVITTLLRRPVAALLGWIAASAAVGRVSRI